MTPKVLLTHGRHAVVSGDPGAAPVKRENPSKRLRSPRAGDRLEFQALVSDHTEGQFTAPIDVRRRLLTAYHIGLRSDRRRLLAQRLELRRLNRVIQQISWRLHKTQSATLAGAKPGRVLALLLIAVACGAVLGGLGVGALALQ